MKRTLFNENWTVKPGVQDPFSALFGGAAQGKPVTLPHDAMIEEDRDPNCESGGQAGFYPAKSYTYTKVSPPPRLGRADAPWWSSRASCRKPWSI